MKHRIVTFMLTICMIATLCAPAFATEKAQDTGNVVLVVEGRDMQIYSEPAGEVIDATAFIYDFETQSEASDEIYRSYARFKMARGAGYGDWEYASRTVTCYLNTGTILGLYNAYGEISTGVSGVQTISARVRLYSQSVGSVSISNTAVADSGSVIENYSNYVWAEANASTSKTVKSAIATFSAYQPGYNTFTCSLKAAVP